MRLKILYFSLWGLLFTPVIGLGQAHSILGEAGLPLYLRHFTGQEYGAYHQNWAIAQDARGVIYVANRDGVLEYDGSNWRIIKTQTTVRSLSVNRQGEIFVGQQGDFGVLRPDSLGALRYVSLLDKVHSSDRDFHDVWGTYAANAGVYFQTSHVLFRWDGTTMKVWRSVPGYHTAFEVRGRFFIRERGIGLKEIVNDSLRSVPGGSFFAEKRIYMMAPYGRTRTLVGTRNEGFFLYDGTSFVPFPTEVDKFLEQYGLYHGAAIPGGQYALATLGGGVLIIDVRGRLLRVLNQSAELPDDVVNFVYPDRQGGLWMALNNQGVVRAFTPSPVTQYDDRLDLYGAVYDMKRHRDTLYVATGAGLFFLDAHSVRDRLDLVRSKFLPVEGVERAWSILSANKAVFVAGDAGLYRVSRGRGIRIGDDITPCFDLLKSHVRNGLIFVGRKDGLAVLKREAGTWKIHGVKGVNEEIRSIVEENDGTLWLGTRHQGVVRLKYDARLDKATDIELLTTRDGLPGSGMTIANVLGRPLFYKYGESRVFRYNNAYAATHGKGAAEKFYPDPTLTPFVAASRDSIQTISEDKWGNIWIAYPRQIDKIERKNDGTYERRTYPDLKFAHSNVERIFPERNAIWFNRGNVLYRFETDFHRDIDPSFGVLIRQVYSIGFGSWVFRGAFQDQKGHVAIEQDKSVLPSLRFDRNDLAFEVAASAFNDSETLQYQYFLSGSDPAWSSWTTKRERTYTNIPPGLHHFRVRARNGRGEISREGEFTFSILPPWYRTWWAISLYFLLAFTGCFMVWKYWKMLQAHRLALVQAKELAQERIVRERLQQANANLKVANERLKQANKLKDEFLATTSHELRTPLTAILGFTEVLKLETPEDASQREFLNIIEESGNRLMHTLTSLLEIAKLRAGVLEVKREAVNLGRQAAEVVRMFSEEARKKDLTLKLIEQPKPVLALVDRHAFERILSNLLGNALKFTEVGSVTVSFEQNEEMVTMKVTDTGIGIDDAFRPHLFEEFRQESDGLSRSHEGSGLGLAITARLVELMHGEMHVESRKGHGSIFVVSFPVQEAPATMVRQRIPGLGTGEAG